MIVVGIIINLVFGIVIAVVVVINVEGAISNQTVSMIIIISDGVNDPIIREFR